MTLISLAGPRDGSTTFHSFSPLRSTTSTLPPSDEARALDLRGLEGREDGLVAQVGGAAGEIAPRPWPRRA